MGAKVAAALVACVMTAAALPGTAHSAAEEWFVLDGAHSLYACGAGGGWVGPAELGVPHPAPGPASRAKVECTSRKAASSRASTMSASIAARGTGTSTEGTVSYVDPFLLGRYKLAAATPSIEFDATFTVDQAVADVPPQARATTKAVVMVILNVIHSTCKPCSSSEVVVLADTLPITDTPETLKGQTFKLSATATNPNGNVPKGTINVNIVAGTYVFTDSYTEPLGAQGSSTITMKVTKTIVHRG
ncbi:MAG TPA: hypothetical protein VM030_11910 [Acidimicrobiales bacterium]|nr:hypothetical protein [Acidimicrobiales bacterium]